MSTSELKASLHNLIDAIDDQSILEAIHTILSGKKSGKTDWWNELSEADKKLIQQGISELEAGKGISHEQVQKKVSNFFRNHE